MSAKLLSVFLLADITSRRCQFIVCLRAAVLHKYLQCRAGGRSMGSFGNWWSLKAREASYSTSRNWSVWGLANFGTSSQEKQSHGGRCPCVCSVCPKGTVGYTQTDVCELNLCTAITLLSGQYKQGMIMLASNPGLFTKRICITFYGWRFWRLLKQVVFCSGIPDYVWSSYMQSAFLACVCIKNGYKNQL